MNAEKIYEKAEKRLTISGKCGTIFKQSAQTASHLRCPWGCANRICEGGGTGRRARLRCVWFILGGSSPLPRTKNQYTSCAGFSFCAREGISNKAAAFMPQAISPVQQQRPQPAAETGRSCWGRVLIFQSPAKGLRKNQLTQPVAVA